MSELAFPMAKSHGNRREWLRWGGLGAGVFGAANLALPDLLQAESGNRTAAAQTSSDTFGRAKSCILLFLFGAPAHQDTFDLKPDAPKEIRGEFQPIQSSLPGVAVCEHLPLLAQRLDLISQIRSVTHPDNTHTVAMHYMLTGVRHARPATNPRNAPDDFPCFGAVANYLARQQTRAELSAAARTGQSAAALPAGLSLNAPANQVSANNHIFPGFFAGVLGAGFDPVFVSQSPDKPGFQPWDAASDPARLLSRKDLLGRLAVAPARNADQPPIELFDDSYRRAFELLTAPALHTAFQLAAEPETLRRDYGLTPFGQGCLLARRLVERGARLVTVNWERDDAYWDTHRNNFKDLKEKLLPNFDRGLSTLLDDLQSRGLLEETLVVCLGEFGRTPQINTDAGRDHWAACNTVLLAGAGIQPGTVYGASDKAAAYPAKNPVTPEDLAATIYHLLGISAETQLHDPLGRPWRLSAGEPIRGVLQS